MNSRLCSSIVIAIFLCLGKTSWAVEDERHFLGGFSNVVISPMSGDCDGISLKLWKYRDSTGRTRISGFYYDATSTCNGEAVPISDENYDEKTGRVKLQAKDKESGSVVAEFSGEFRKEFLTGTFGFGSLGSKEIGPGWQVKLKRLNSRDWKRIGGT